MELLKRLLTEKLDPSKVQINLELLSGALRQIFLFTESFKNNNVDQNSSNFLFTEIQLNEETFKSNVLVLAQILHSVSPEEAASAFSHSFTLPKELMKEINEQIQRQTNRDATKILSGFPEKTPLYFFNQLMNFTVEAYKQVQFQKASADSTVSPEKVVTHTLALLKGLQSDFMCSKNGGSGSGWKVLYNDWKKGAADPETLKAMSLLAKKLDTLSTEDFLKQFQDLKNGLIYLNRSGLKYSPLAYSFFALFAKHWDEIVKLISDQKDNSSQIILIQNLIELSANQLSEMNDCVNFSLDLTHIFITKLHSLKDPGDKVARIQHFKALSDVMMKLGEIISIQRKPGEEAALKKIEEALERVVHSLSKLLNDQTHQALIKKEIAEKDLGSDKNGYKTFISLLPAALREKFKPRGKDRSEWYADTAISYNPKNGEAAQRYREEELFGIITECFGGDKSLEFHREVSLGKYRFDIGFQQGSNIILFEFNGMSFHYLYDCQKECFVLNSHSQSKQSMVDRGLADSSQRPICFQIPEDQWLKFIGTYNTCKKERPEDTKQRKEDFLLLLKNCSSTEPAQAFNYRQVFKVLDTLKPVQVDAPKDKPVMMDLDCDEIPKSSFSSIATSAGSAFFPPETSPPPLFSYKPSRSHSHPKNDRYSGLRGEYRRENLERSGILPKS